MDPMHMLKLLTLTSVVVLLQAPVAWAQIPAHAPGAICNTPSGWCWARPPGLPGAPCNCPVGEGSVQGILG